MFEHRHLPLALFLASGLFSVGNVAAQTIAKPTLNKPSNGAKDWLFNKPANGSREGFEWGAVTNATGYQIVISSTSNFDGFTDGATPSCKASCVYKAIGKVTMAGVDQFFGQWWLRDTYFWRVRATAGGKVGAWSDSRTFLPTSKPAIVASAMLLDSKPRTESPASQATSSTKGARWLDETTDGDGGRLRTAMALYDKAPAKDKSPSLSKSLKDSMDVALTNAKPAKGQTVWAAAERLKLIDRIVLKQVAGKVPTDDQGTLDRLGIRAQCKEFVDRMVNTGGGKSTTYTGAPLTNGNARPGMYVFMNTNEHAAIVNAVKFESGDAVWVRRSEANWGGGWNSNPRGQVPWARMVSHSEEVQLDKADAKARTFRARLSF